MRWWRENPRDVPAPFDATIPIEGLIIAGRDKSLDDDSRRRLLHINHGYHDLRPSSAARSADVVPRVLMLACRPCRRRRLIVLTLDWLFISIVQPRNNTLDVPGIGPVEPFTLFVLLSLNREP